MSNSSRIVIATLRTQPSLRSPFNASPSRGVLIPASWVVTVPWTRTVWCYCKVSAKFIFSQEEENPLESLLLENIIKAQPGINRKGLHKATGGHIAAATLMEALVGIRDRGLVRCETTATGGRPAERWCPCEQTNKESVGIVPGSAGHSSFARNESVATENTAASATPPDAQPARDADQQPTNTASPTAPMTLAELSDTLNRIGGRLVRQGDAVVIDAGDKPLSPDIEAALVTHQQALAQVVPVAQATNDTPTPALLVEEPTLTNPADFFCSLREIRARAAQQQQAEASGASASETLSG